MVLVYAREAGGSELEARNGGGTLAVERPQGNFAGDGEIRFAREGAFDELAKQAHTRTRPIGGLNRCQR